MTGTQASAYFDDLFDRCCDVIERFPITIEPAGMAYIIGPLAAEVEAGRSANPFDEPDAQATAPRRGDGAVGMNTIGILLDRLTILALKRWNLIHRKRDEAAAATLMAGQVADIVAALQQTRPGSSSINNKLTSRRVDVDIPAFAQAIYGLITINLLLWESQEILYNHDIMALPPEELRTYIDFFSKGNITRNVFIQACEQLFWKAAG